MRPLPDGMLDDRRRRSRTSRSRWPSRERRSQRRISVACSAPTRFGVGGEMFGPRRREAAVRTAPPRRRSGNSTSVPPLTRTYRSSSATSLGGQRIGAADDHDRDTASSVGRIERGRSRCPPTTPARCGCDIRPRTADRLRGPAARRCCSTTAAHRTRGSADRVPAIVDAGIDALSIAVLSPSSGTASTRSARAPTSIGHHGMSIVARMTPIDHWCVAEPTTAAPSRDPHFGALSRNAVTRQLARVPTPAAERCPPDIDDRAHAAHSARRRVG